MNGLLRIALKLLANDRGKFVTLIVGITFAVFLIMMMTSAFFGILHRTASNIYNLNAKMWVMDPSVNVATDNIPMPNYVLDAVRSIPGVKYAVPVFLGGGLLKLNNGHYQSATIIGLDDATLFGRPEMLEGDISSIYNNDAYIAVKDSEFEKLNNAHIGSLFEVNDHRGVIVGIAKALVGGLFGTPTLYTTYNRAISSLPTSRFTLSYILVEPKNIQDYELIKTRVHNIGYMALTTDEFLSKNTKYYVYQTGIGTNILSMTIISFIVGLSIVGQTFYTFVLENLDKFGALKAIGAKKQELIQMIFFQAAVVGFIGYGIGVLLASVFITLAKLRLPSYASLILYQNLGISFFMVLIIVCFSSYLGIRKVIKIDPFDIFRG